jgi:hypothetical protein
MIKNTAAALALLFTVACSSMPMNNSNSNGGGSSLLNAPVATRSVDAAQYILLDAPAQVRQVDFTKVISGLHIRGTMTNRGFYPASGKIEGRGQLCADGKDWLALSDLTVHKASEGKTPTAPYVLGCATSSGFQPASRDIVMQ